MNTNVDIEKAVLGAILLDKYAFDRVVDVLNEKCFSNENALIFKAMSELYSNNKPVDILTLNHKLKENKQLDLAGGIIYITKLTDRVGSSANIEYHARLLLQEFLRKEAIRIGQENISDAVEGLKDVFEIYTNAVSKYETTLNGVLKHDVAVIGKIHDKVIIDSRKVASSGVKSGVPTGYRNIDNFTNGWQKTDLIILAGRPAMGKSVCALAFALNPALKENIPTAIFSLEMSQEQLVGRAQSVLSQIDSSRIIKKQLENHEIDLLESKCKELKNAPIYIDDTPALTLMDLKGKARKLVRDKGVKLIIIDYLQLMVGDHNKNGSRELEVSTISRGLKALAKELDVPIIALSQLNRLVESRSDKKPILSDLRESGSIEQDADMVLFCFRPEYYQIENYEMGNEQISSEGLMVLIVAKHRAGQLGELRLGFNGKFTKLENYDAMREKAEEEKYWQKISTPNTIKPNPVVSVNYYEKQDEGDEEVPF